MMHQNITIVLPILNSKSLTMALGAGLKGTMIGPIEFWSTQGMGCIQN
jgi:hypothetical protein